MLENKYNFEFPQFFGADLEPFSFEESLHNFEDFPFWDKDQSKQIFPFAQTGGGDWYGFCFGMKSDTSLPIVLMSHDNDYALFLAENLEDFIFYKMLMASLKMDEECDHETFIAELYRVLSTHKKYLRREYVKDLEQLYSGQMEGLSENELEEIYIKETACTRFGEELYCGI